MIRTVGQTNDVFENPLEVFFTLFIRCNEQLFTLFLILAQGHLVDTATVDQTVEDLPVKEQRVIYKQRERRGHTHTHT